jgi:hypothetical protein
MPEQDKKHSDIEFSASITVAAFSFAASRHASGRFARFRFPNAAIAKRHAPSMSRSPSRPACPLDGRIRMEIDFPVHHGKPAYRHRKKPYTADIGKIIIGGVQ